MAKNFLTQIFGSRNDRLLKQYRKRADRINALEAQFEQLSDEQLRAKTQEFRERVAAGAPLDEPGGATATVDRVVEIGGPGRLRLVHANDSKDVRGSMKDRHERIGRGHIGAAAFGELFAHPALAGVPFVLETPGSRDEDGDLAVLRAIRDGVRP